MISDLGANIRAAVKLVMKRKGLYYRDLADHLEVSESTVKRILSKEDMDLERLLKICQWLGLSLTDIEDIIGSAKPDFTTMTQRQEQVLADNIDYLRVFRGLLLKNKADFVCRRYQLDADYVATIIKDLESVGLVNRLDGDKVQVLKTWPFRWLEDGPLFNQYYKDMLGTFSDQLANNPNDNGGKVEPFELVLNQENYLKLQQDLSELKSRYQRLGRLLMNYNDIEDLKEISGLIFVGAFSPWDHL
ncbi:MAG: helix-turn-helix transcriptional regulator [Pseudobacteriovorax sp.]|nr:helix-turn-helix transcriptional regulator [Pseudobacteriovorax sp.]